MLIGKPSNLPDPAFRHEKSGKLSLQLKLSNVIVGLQ
jgi:hypothetical protein